MIIHLFTVESVGENASKKMTIQRKATSEVVLFCGCLLFFVRLYLTTFSDIFILGVTGFSKMTQLYLKISEDV